MDAYSEIYAVNRTRHNATQESVLVPDNRLVPRVYLGTHMGPWGWQWEDGVHNIVSASPSSRPITLDALMNGVEEIMPGASRIITDSAYSRSRECPFIVHEPRMADLRSRLQACEKTLLPPDAQVGLRKLIAAALGMRKGPTPEKNIHAVVYPYPVDAQHTMNRVWGPRQSFTNETDSGSGTMSMDLGTEASSP